MSLKAQLNYFCGVLTMILKVVDENNSTIGAVQVYENNFDGKTEVQDAYHIKAINDGFDSVFGSNDEEIAVIIDIGEFKENCLIAGEVFAQWNGECDDEYFYKNCIESICDKLNIGSGPIPERVYEIWTIIEEKYL